MEKSEKKQSKEIQRNSKETQRYRKKNEKKRENKSKEIGKIEKSMINCTIRKKRGT